MIGSHLVNSLLSFILITFQCMRLSLSVSVVHDLRLENPGMEDLDKLLISALFEVFFGVGYVIYSYLLFRFAIYDL